MACNISGVFMSQLLYAGDLCLLCQSAKVEQMLSIVVLLIQCLAILHKTLCMLTAHSYDTEFRHPLVKLCGVLLEYVNSWVFWGFFAFNYGTSLNRGILQHLILELLLIL